MKGRPKSTILFLLVAGLALCILLAVAPVLSGYAADVDQLIKDLRNSSWQIRWDAAAGLGETKDPRAVGPLSAALQDENSYVRMTAARSLGMIDDPRVVAALIQALKDESHGVRKNAILSLKERTGQDLGKEPEAWLKWWENRQ